MVWPLDTYVALYKELLILHICKNLLCVAVLFFFTSWLICSLYDQKIIWVFVFVHISHLFPMLVIQEGDKCDLLLLLFVAVDPLIYPKHVHNVLCLQSECDQIHPILISKKKL